MLLKALADTALAILIAAKKNAVYIAKGAVNTVKNLAIKSAKKAKQVAYKLMHKESLGKNPVETTTNLGDINHLGHSGLKRNIRDAKFGKVKIIKETDKSDVDNIVIQAKKNKLDEDLDIQGQIQKGLREMELSDEIESLSEDNTEDGYRARNAYVSSIDLKIRTEENNKKIEEQNKELIQQYKRKQDLDNKAKKVNEKEAKVSAVSMAGMQYSRAEDLKIKNEAIKYENEDRVEEETKKGIAYKYSSKDGFSFYKVKKQINNGCSPMLAIDKAGMITNVQFRLDTKGAGIIRILDKNAVELAMNVKAQLYIESLIVDKMAIPCIIGVKNQTNFSVALLICDDNLKNGFGVAVLKRDKPFSNYVLDLSDTMARSNMLTDGREYYNFSASKSMLRQAFPCAICIDLDTGYMSNEDTEELNMLMKEHIMAYRKLDEIIRRVKGELDFSASKTVIDATKAVTAKINKALKK